MKITKTIEKKKQKSLRNKTIDFTVEEGAQYLEKCISFNKLNGDLELTSIIDKTINGDTIEVMEKLPKKFVDLMIVDPPYNLSKNYHGNYFGKQNDDDYIKFTKQWIIKAIPLLKDNATIYVCCDWKSSLIIGNVLAEFF